MPLRLEGALEDETGQEDGQDGVGVNLADEMRGLPDDSEIVMVYSEDNA